MPFEDLNWSINYLVLLNIIDGINNGIVYSFHCVTSLKLIKNNNKQFVNSEKVKKTDNECHLCNNFHPGEIKNLAFETREMLHPRR